MATTFFVESYPEWENCFCAKQWAESKDKEWLMIKHYGEVKEDGSPKKEHYHTLVRTGNDMSLSAFCKNVGIEERWVRERNNWQETARYMVHESESAVKEGKKKFPLNELEGSLKERAIAYIRKKQNPGKARIEDDDKGVIKIIEFIDSIDYCSYNVLVRWCVQEGLYSTLRRGGSLISRLLEEHNRSCQFTLQDTLYQMRLEDMEKRLSAAEKELQRAYGDLFERIKNPFDGKYPWEENRKYGVNMDAIKEILETA